MLSALFYNIEVCQRRERLNIHDLAAVVAQVLRIVVALNQLHGRHV
jgi:hypothetical protein